MTAASGRVELQAHRLLQLGVSLFLFALLVGIAIPQFAVPRLGLSTHLLAISQGLFLLLMGLIWPRLQLTPRVGGLAFWLLAYGCLAALLANFMGAIWGAGNTLLPMAAGAARGSALQEGFVVIALRSGGAALIGGTAVVLWGLRRPR